MAVPVGTWNVITDKHSANLHITSVDAQGKITGTIDVNTTPPETHNVSGTWDATKSELSFNYSLRLFFGGGPGRETILGPSFLFPVLYTGYLFQAHMREKCPAFAGH
jgi:hypothetical protein